MSVRAILRQAAEVAIGATGTVAVVRRWRRGVVPILAYHNVVPVEEAGRGDASLHLPLPHFVAQVERVAKAFDIVDLATAVSEPAPGPGPRAVITFDDAYRGAVTLALPELARRGIPATVFVSPALLGTPSTWWDEAAEAGVLSPEWRERALTDLHGKSGAIRDLAFTNRRVPALPPSFGIATADELDLHCGDGVALGSHAWAHEHLPSLPAPELETSLRKTLQWLAERPGRTVTWLAAPYGATSEAVSRTARTLGHAGVLRIDGGPWNPVGDQADLPRINVPAGVSLRGLDLRTIGLIR